jgi:hypothetical protein
MGGGVQETLELRTTACLAGISGKTQKSMFLNCVLKPVFRFDRERAIQE